MAPRKRIGRSAKSLRRARPTREPYERVLIVCEGSKTEPTYLQAVVDELELSSANIVITGKSGSSPLSVFKHAKHLFEVDSENGSGYDRVFCVFDKDSHASYTEALDLIGRPKPDRVFEAITSIPCFEYWILLHFEYTTRAFERSGSKSPCECVLTELQKHLPKYSKGMPELYSLIHKNTEIALQNAERANRAASAVAATNPTTKMGRLVKYLQQVKKPSLG